MKSHRQTIVVRHFKLTVNTYSMRHTATYIEAKKKTFQVTNYESHRQTMVVCHFKLTVNTYSMAYTGNIYMKVTGITIVECHFNKVKKKHKTQNKMTIFY